MTRCVRRINGEMYLVGSAESDLAALHRAHRVAARQELAAWVLLCFLALAGGVALLGRQVAANDEAVWASEDAP